MPPLNDQYFLDQPYFFCNFLTYYKNIFYYHLTYKPLLLIYTEENSGDVESLGFADDLLRIQLIWSDITWVKL